MHLSGDMKHASREESSQSFSQQKKNHRKFSDKLHNLIKKNGWLTK